MEEPVQTRLHRLLNPNFYGYQGAPWRLFLRKEVPVARGEAEWGLSCPLDQIMGLGPGEQGQGKAELEDR